MYIPHSSSVRLQQLTSISDAMHSVLQQFHNSLADGYNDFELDVMKLSTEEIMELVFNLEELEYTITYDDGTSTVYVSI